VAADPATGGRNHGDEVIADALANKALGDEPEVKLRPEGEEAAILANPPEYTMAWRRKRWQERQREESEWGSSRESLSGWEENSETLSGWEPGTLRNGW
jgi:hypothetical protein